MKKIFNEEFLRKLEKLRLFIKSYLVGLRDGEYSSKKRGGVIDFASHRSYSQGDEFRYIDWNIFSRTHSLFIKEFEKDEALTVNLIIDTSRSMNFGSHSKLDFAKEIAGALAYISLVCSNKVKMFAIPSEVHFYPDVSGVNSALKGLEIISKIKIGATENFAKVIKDLRGTFRKKSVFLIISDLWDGEKLEEELKILKASGNVISVIHILSKEELLPSPRGRLRLIDSEENIWRDRFIGEEEFTKYKDLLRKYIDDWKHFCFKNQINYIFTSTEAKFDDVVLIYFRECGILE